MKVRGDEESAGKREARKAPKSKRQKNKTDRRQERKKIAKRKAAKKEQENAYSDFSGNSLSSIIPAINESFGEMGVGTHFKALTKKYGQKRLTKRQRKSLQDLLGAVKQRVEEKENATVVFVVV